MFARMNLAQIKLALLVILAVSLPFSESIKSIALFLLLAIFIVKIYRKEISLKITILHAAFLGLMVSAFISSMFAESMTKGLKGFYDITYCSLAFFVAASVNDEKQSRVILWSLYVSTAAAAVVGITHLIQTNSTIEIHQLRNPNYIAMYLIIILCSMISTISLSERENIISKMILGMLALLVLWAAVLTEYRSSFIGLFALIFMLLFSQKNIKHSFLTGVALLSVSISAIFLYKPLWNKLTTTRSLIARFYLWDGAVDYFRKNPFFGIGPNQYNYMHPAGSPTAGTINTDAHSIYFNVLAQMGLVGFVFLAMLMYGFIREFFTARTMTGFGLSLKYGALGAFLVTFAGGLFDTTLHHGHAIAFALLLGLFVAHESEAEEKLAVPDKTGST